MGILLRGPTRPSYRCISCCTIESVHDGQRCNMWWPLGRLQHTYLTVVNAQSLVQVFRFGLISR